MQKIVTLVCTEAHIPYTKGDIFSVEEKVSKKYLEAGIVRLYDPKKDADLLEAQRGKVGDDVAAENTEDDAKK